MLWRSLKRRDVRRCVKDGNFILYATSGADPGFFDRGFKLDEGGGGVGLCSYTIFSEIPHENEII